MSNNPIKVMIVDDNDASRLIVVLSLKKCGCVSTKEAKNGLEALNMAQAEKFDMIFMDIQMPIMDGITAIKEIRKLKGYSGVPIIAVSASEPTICKPSCLQAGADDYIVLPGNNGIYADMLCSYVKDKINA